jgi:ATP-dependent exoDNAse (exonuclease V) beta subunit
MRLLTDILQDYTQFRVSTIDGFFQQIVRSFARELNVNNQYKVELEIDRILEIAVDNMLTTLGEADKKQLLNWLTEFASEQVDNEKTWNPRNSILALAKLITTEEFVSQKKKFGFKLEKLNEYKQHLQNIIKKYEEDAEAICKQASALFLTLPKSKEEMFAKCDIISLHIPLKPETRGSINASLFEAMPKNGIVVNTARKEIINEDDLIQVMRQREDIKYITDIQPDKHDEMTSFGDRYLATPKKTGAQTSEANANAGFAAARQIADFFATGNKRFQVNK